MSCSSSMLWRRSAPESWRQNEASARAVPLARSYLLHSGRTIEARNEIATEPSIALPVHWIKLLYSQREIPITTIHHHCSQAPELMSRETLGLDQLGL